MSTSTYTRTYTVVDVRRVVDCFAADYDMVAQATGLATQQYVADVVHDVKALAELSCLAHVDLALKDATGIVIRAAKYEISTDASFWTAQRPGNNLWPRTPDGRLIVVLSYTGAWRELGESGQLAVQRQYLRVAWTRSTVDLAYPGLSGQVDRQYASNAFGMRRTSYR